MNLRRVGPDRRCAGGRCGSVAAGAEIHGVAGRVRCGGGAEPRAAVRAPRPGGRCSPGPGRRRVAQPHRAGWAARTRRLLHPRLHPRLRTSIGAEIMGAQQVRPTAWTTAGRRVDWLVGWRAPVSHPGVRADTPPAPSFTLSYTTFDLVSGEPAGCPARAAGWCTTCSGAEHGIRAFGRPAAVLRCN